MLPQFFGPNFFMPQRCRLHGTLHSDRPSCRGFISIFSNFHHLTKNYNPSEVNFRCFALALFGGFFAVFDSTPLPQREFFRGIRFFVVCNEIFPLFRFLHYRKSCPRKGVKIGFAWVILNFDFWENHRFFSKFCVKICVKIFKKGFP